MYIIVSPFWKTFDDKGLIYFVPDFLEWEIKIGNCIEIPIRKTIEIAIVLKVINEEEIEINLEKIKSIISIKNRNILLNNYQIFLTSWISKYYFCQIHHSLNLFFPTNIREKLKKDNFDTFLEKINLNYKKNKILNRKKIFLSHLQEKAYKEILNSKNNKILFYWITWSWKTEIYIKLIEKILLEGKQALLLIPEIILNNQIWEKLISYFWKEVLIINSSITQATKAIYWANIFSNKSRIIIWTRSSLFYPYKNLWLIIVDEQHDNSYNSDKSPRFKTLEVVEEISEELNIKVLFASWTPSINYMYKTIKEDLGIVTLLEKYNNI